MFTSTAHVPTDRASRYLSQLCKHVGQLGHFSGHQPRSHADADAAPKARAEWSGTEAIIDFSWGRCILRATGDSLILRAEADGEEQLQRIQEGIAARLARIGRRDGLAVNWQDDVSGQSQAITAGGGRQ